MKFVLAIGTIRPTAFRNQGSQKCGSGKTLNQSKKEKVVSVCTRMKFIIVSYWRRDAFVQMKQPVKVVAGQQHSHSDCAGGFQLPLVHCWTGRS